jgi:hypothetical protein
MRVPGLLADVDLSTVPGEAAPAGLCASTTVANAIKRRTAAHAHRAGTRRDIWQLKTPILEAHHRKP